MSPYLKKVFLLGIIFFSFSIPHINAMEEEEDQQSPLFRSGEKELETRNKDTEVKSYIDVTAHNVGQGNCITAKLFDSSTNKTKYLLFDAGSSAYKKELLCQDYFSKKAQQGEELTKSERELSPQQTHKTVDVPASILRSATPGESRVLKEKPGRKGEKLKDKLIQQIRTSLGMSGHSSPINVETFFISHPDSDHYNLAEDIFTHRRDKIFNIILGGLPESYCSSFGDWLQKQITNKNTKVYFPALKLQQPISSMNELIFKCTTSKDEMYSPLYAPQMFSDPKMGWKPVEYLKNFEDALPFTDNIQTYLLSVNPTHREEVGETEVSRSSFSDDDNSDSLVIKLQIEEHSIIITGDATELTTNRILRNYRDNLKFLESTVITSDHHGSKTHGSNSLKWIKATAPHCVIFSSGITHGHPSLYAYENSKQSPNLTQTKEAHDIWVWEMPGKKEDKDTGESQAYARGRSVKVHKTYNSLFSTFSNGSLTFNFTPQENVVLTSQIVNSDTFTLTSTSYEIRTTSKISKDQSKEDELGTTIDDEEFEKIEKSMKEKPESSTNFIEPKALFSFSPASRGIEDEEFADLDNTSAREDPSESPTKKHDTSDKKRKREKQPAKGTSTHSMESNEQQQESKLKAQSSDKQKKKRGSSSKRARIDQKEPSNTQQE